VNIGVIPGVSATNPLASLPADLGDGSSYNFALGLITVPNGFTQGTTIAQSQITQLWSGAGIPFHRVRRWAPASAMLSMIGDLQTGVLITERWGFGYNAVVAFRHTSTNPIPVDGSIDWSKRFINVTMIRASGAAVPAHQVVTAGGETQRGSGYTGTNSGAAVNLAFTSISPSRAFSWNTNGSNGYSLFVQGQQQPVDTTNGDHYLAFIEATDQFVF
jgi:hypothetical protein